MAMTIDEARAIIDDWMETPALRAHVRSVEIAMRALAAKYGEDPEEWAVAGLLHDADYERWPEEHPRRIVALLEERGESRLAHAILCHYTQWGHTPETLLDRALLATDELTGLIIAVARLRPNRLQDLTAKSVKKKLKDKAFARGVDRDEVRIGLELLGVTPDEHITFIVEALRPHEDEVIVGG